MPRFAQIDLVIVTGLLDASAMPSVVPPGRTFVDVTSLPVDPLILGYVWGGGLIFTPPNEAVQLPTDLTRIVTKVGA
jgi:hypothetical protein